MSIIKDVLTALKTYMTNNYMVFLFCGCFLTLISIAAIGMNKKSKSILANVTILIIGIAFVLTGLFFGVSDGLNKTNNDTVADAITDVVVTENAVDSNGVEVYADDKTRNEKEST